jgi:ribosome-binding factor A
MTGTRPQRVAEVIRKHIAEVLLRHIGDPRLSGLMVTRVEVTPDLGAAKVFLRAVATLGAEERRGVERAAERAGPLLRRGLGPLLGIKKTPDLTFKYDSGQDAVDRIEELLGEIERENGSRSS